MDSATPSLPLEAPVPLPPMDRRRLRTLIGVAAVLVGIGIQWRSPLRDAPPDVPGSRAPDASFLDQSAALERAWREHQGGLFLTVEARVTALLSDDAAGDRHQRMIVALASGHTVLVSHNIDLAPRVAGLRVGAMVRVRGEYEWNDQGGVLHWTHHDPQGRREGGWIEYDGRRYR